MQATRQLYEAGQSLWLDQITRALVDGGGLARYIDDFSISGLTSNPTIFDHAIDLDVLAADLQRQGADAFVRSWDGLLACIAGHSAALVSA